MLLPPWVSVGDARNLVRPHEVVICGLECIKELLAYSDKYRLLVFLPPEVPCLLLDLLVPALGYERRLQVGGLDLKPLSFLVDGGLPIPRLTITLYVNKLMKLFAIKYHTRVVGQGRYQVNVDIGAEEYLLANQLRIGLVLLEYQEESVE